MKVIAVMGSICAGKDSLKDYLEKKYKYKAIKLGNILRGEAIERGIRVNRNNLYKLDKKLGTKFLMERAIEEAEKHEIKKLVLGDIRKLDEIEYLKKRFGSKLKIIRLDADLAVRFKRIKNRRRAGDPKTLAEFKRIDALENKRFNLKKLFKYADYTIVNNDGYETLYKEARKIMKRVK